MPPMLFLIEFIASNQIGITDPDETDEYPDWIEIDSPGDLGPGRGMMGLRAASAAPSRGGGALRGALPPW